MEGRWYYYNGAVPVPVVLCDGKVVAARPRHHIFAPASSVAKYGARFQPTARPVNHERLMAMYMGKATPPPSAKVLAEHSPTAKKVKEIPSPKTGAAKPVAPKSGEKPSKPKGAASTGS